MVLVINRVHFAAPMSSLFSCSKLLVLYPCPYQINVGYRVVNNLLKKKTALGERKNVKAQPPNVSVSSDEGKCISKLKMSKKTWSEENVFIDCKNKLVKKF